MNAILRIDNVTTAVPHSEAIYTEAILVHEDNVNQRIAEISGQPDGRYIVGLTTTYYPSAGYHQWSTELQVGKDYVD